MTIFATNNTAIKDRVVDLEAAMSTSQSTLTTHGTDIGNAQSDISTLQNEVSDLQWVRHRWLGDELSLTNNDFTNLNSGGTTTTPDTGVVITVPATDASYNNVCFRPAIKYLTSKIRLTFQFSALPSGIFFIGLLAWPASAGWMSVSSRYGLGRQDQTWQIHAGTTSSGWEYEQPTPDTDTVFVIEYDRVAKTQKFYQNGVLWRTDSNVTMADNIRPVYALDGYAVVGAGSVGIREIIYEYLA